MFAARPNPDAATRPFVGCPTVWIGCLGCYNAGHLVGDWFDALDCPMDGDELANTGVRVPLGHDADAHEEVWVMDHEGFGGVLTGSAARQRRGGWRA